MGQQEKERGDKWADRLRRQGCWVEKLQPPPAGLPDWLVVDPRRGIRLVEAKTLEAVMAAACCPWAACSGAQQLVLHMVSEHGGQAAVLVLGEDGYVEFPCEAAKGIAVNERVFNGLKVAYDG